MYGFQIYLRQRRQQGFGVHLQAHRILPYKASREHRSRQPVKSFRFDGFPYLGLWTKGPGANFVCVEPWYGIASPTGEPGEPFIASSSQPRSIWYHWTAPVSGPTFFSTAGSAFDTILGIFTGSITLPNEKCEVLGRAALYIAQGSACDFAKRGAIELFALPRSDE